MLAHLRGRQPERKVEVGGALKLLALHAQSAAQQRALEDTRSEQEVFASIDAKIDAMRERTAANEAEIARTADGDSGSNDGGDHGAA